MTTILQLPISEIHQHPSNPRRDLGDLVELSDSIRAHGIRQALVVVPGADEGTYVMSDDERHHIYGEQAEAESPEVA